MPHSEHVELPGEPRLNPPPLITTLGMGLENLSVVLGMQESAEGSALRLAQEQEEDDKALLHEALADIMQLLITEEHEEAASSSIQEEPPSWVCIRWVSITMHYLARKRQTMLHQGRRLLSHNYPLGLSQVEEQLLTYIFLDEPSWSAMFPCITNHCKISIASKLKPLLPEIDSGGARMARSRGLPTFCPRSDSILPRQNSEMIDLRPASRTCDALLNLG